MILPHHGAGKHPAIVAFEDNFVVKAGGKGLAWTDTVGIVIGFVDADRDGEHSWRDCSFRGSHWTLIHGDADVLGGAGVVDDRPID